MCPPTHRLTPIDCMVVVVKVSSNTHFSFFKIFPVLNRFGLVVAAATGTWIYKSRLNIYIECRGSLFYEPDTSYKFRVQVLINLSGFASVHFEANKPEWELHYLYRAL